MWWPGTELNRRRQPFQATLCCSLNDLSDSGWPPKYLRNRERHANRGLESWVQKPGRNLPDCFCTAIETARVMP
jgi:hypothetical protein